MERVQVMCDASRTQRKLNIVALSSCSLSQFLFPRINMSVRLSRVFFSHRMLMKRQKKHRNEKEVCM